MCPKWKKNYVNYKIFCISARESDLDLLVKIIPSYLLHENILNPDASQEYTKKPSKSESDSRTEGAEQTCKK